MTTAELVAEVQSFAEEIAATCTDLIDHASDYDNADRKSERDDALEAISATFAELSPDYQKLRAAVLAIERRHS